MIKKLVTLLVGVMTGLALMSVPASASVPDWGVVKPGAWRFDRSLDHHRQAIEAHPGVTKKGVSVAPPSPFTGPGYYYADAQEVLTGGNTVAGIQANVEVDQPMVEVPVGIKYSHSLFELALRDAAGNSIEVGWANEGAAFGDTKPRLFSCAWVLGAVAKGCYDGVETGSTWLDNSAAGVPNLGADLTSVATAAFPNNAKQFKVQRQTSSLCGIAGAGWIVSYNSQDIGCWPITLWTHNMPATTFNTATVTDAFGEYYYGGENNAGTSNDVPCGDMGKALYGSQFNGLPIDATDPSWVGSITYLSKSGTFSENLSLFSTDANAYDVASVGSTGNRTVTWGGAGYKFVSGVKTSPGVKDTVPC